MSAESTANASVAPYTPQSCHGVEEALVCGSRIPQTDCNHDGDHRDFAKRHCPQMCGLGCTSTSTVAATATTTAAMSSTATQTSSITATSSTGTAVQPCLLHPVWDTSLILHGDDATRAAAFLPQQIEEIVGSQLFPADTTTWKLLWRGTRDGFAGSEFHNRCDNQGATITVVQSDSGHIFGGVTGVAWSSAGGYVGTNAAFLFGVRTHGSPNAAVIFLPTRNASNAMHDHPDHGPVFGLGHDLNIVSNSNSSSNSYCNLGYTYTGHGITAMNLDADRQYFAGAYKFKVAEIEVFKVQG